MTFYVIYEFDIPKSTPVADHKPPKGVPLTMTEREDHSDEYHYVFGEYGKQRKYAGMLTREQFDTLVKTLDYTASSTQTMGSLTELGWLPAIMFENSSVIGSMYVTPFPDTDPYAKDADDQERIWQRLRKAVISHYS